MGEYQRLTHEFPPVYDENSRILILGSFPSARSRQQQFYYGHPQNRFWGVLYAVTVPEGGRVPETVPARKAFLLEHHIALWDVIAQCEIIGSSDASIRNVVPNDLRLILDAAQIRQIYVNGAAAYRLFERYQRDVCGRDAVRLPSTSPANAAWSLERLTAAWQCVGDYLKEES